MNLSTLTKPYMDRESDMRRAEFYWRSRFPEIVDKEAEGRG
jgi:hypothetical protein